MASALTRMITLFRDPYRPGTGPVVQPWIAPDRRTLITFRQRWPLVSLAVICSTIVVATLPLPKDHTGFLVALAVAGGYALISAALYVWEQRHSTASLRLRQNVHGMRKVGMIVGLTATLWFLPGASSMSLSLMERAKCDWPARRAQMARRSSTASSAFPARKG